MSDPAQPNRLRLGEITALFAILVVGLLLRQYFCPGLIAADDMRHAYHGYFLFSAPAEKYADVYLPDKTLFYRMGVNLPIWVSTHLFGPSLWALALPSLLCSLGTIVLIFFLLRSTVGSLAGLIGAAMAACIPIDVYIAATVLQDCPFAFLLTLALACVIWSEQTQGKRRYLLLLIAGLALGYQQYVKENAVFVLGLFGIWACVKCIEARRVLFRYLTIPLGFLLMQVCFGFLFLAVKGNFLFYVEHFRKLAVFSIRPDYGPKEVYQLSSPFVFKQWQLGYWLAAAPLLCAAAMLRRDFRFRVLVVILFVGQLYSFYVPSRWTPTSRYLIQFTVPYIILLALGLHWIILRLPVQARAWAGAVVVVAAGVAMALPLNMRYHEYGPHRGMAHRRAYDYLLANGHPTDPVYVDTHYGAYTQRALYELGGFKPPLGGFRRLEDAADADSGWVVLGATELRRRRGLPYTTPSNWLEVQRYETDLDGRRRWAAVYQILPPQQPSRDTLRFVPAAGYVALDSFRMPTMPHDVTLTAMTFDEAPEHYAWSTSKTSIRVERDADALVCHVGGETGKTRQVGGIAVDARAPRGVRVTLGFANRENIERVHVALLDKSDRVLGQWCWIMEDGVLPAEQPITLDFVPGKPTGRFEPTGDFEHLRRARRLGVWISVKPKQEATLRVSGLSLGGKQPAEASKPAA